MRDPRLKPAYLLTVKLISLQISCWSLEKMPISSLVVRDVSLHLVLNNLIWQEYPFNPSNLQPQDMESSSTKTTIKGAGGGEKTTVNYSDLSQAEDLVQTGRDQCFQVTVFYFLTGSARLKTAHAAQRHFYLCACTDSHVKSARFLHLSGDHSGCKGVWRSAKGELNQRWWVRKSGIIWPPGTHENNPEWYQHVVTCSPAVWLDLDGRSDDLKSDPTQSCVVQHKCQAKR